MKQRIPNYISELLFLHDCVIIPEFGGFVGNLVPAKLNTATGELSPPSKQILFNNNLKNNDGLLIAYIAEKEAISKTEAQKIVALFVAEINNKLISSKIFRLTNIGLFTISKDNNTLFTQDTKTNYNLTVFGMSPTYNRSIKRENQIKIEQLSNTVNTIRFDKTYRNTILRAAAIILPLIVISYLSISQEEKINSVYEQIADLNPLTILTNKEASSINKKPDKNITENVVISRNLSNPLVPEKRNNRTYYIIAGAFVEKNNAQQMLMKLKKWGYPAEMIKEETFLRISYNSFDNRDAAVLVLNDIKKANPEAWILTK